MWVKAYRSDFEPQCHVFRTKQLRKPRPCHLCHQAVIKQASCCRGESIKSRPTGSLVAGTTPGFLCHRPKIDRACCWSKQRPLESFTPGVGSSVVVSRLLEQPVAPSFEVTRRRRRRIRRNGRDEIEKQEEEEEVVVVVVVAVSVAEPEEGGV
ncbi:hypothetical protein M0802_000275 [Mischocyttarus mexicanus]|nr:hypothetical protein M0802_000275 [Mischocyttarus mexicanus]